MKNTIKKIVLLVTLITTSNQLHSLGAFIGDTLAGVSNVAVGTAENVAAIPGRVARKVGRVTGGNTGYYYNENSPQFYNQNQASLYEQPYYMDEDVVDLRRY